MLSYEKPIIPEFKETKCKICFITDNTGFDYPCDLDEEFHKGFTVGNGKKLYWMITWHSSGHCTVFRKDNDDGLIKRWISGDQMITIHFK